MARRTSRRGTPTAHSTPYPPLSACFSPFIAIATLARLRPSGTPGSIFSTSSRRTPRRTSAGSHTWRNGTVKVRSAVVVCRKCSLIRRHRTCILRHTGDDTPDCRICASRLACGAPRVAVREARALVGRLSLDGGRRLARPFYQFLRYCLTTTGNAVLTWMHIYLFGGTQSTASVGASMRIYFEASHANDLATWSNSRFYNGDVPLGVSTFIQDGSVVPDLYVHSAFHLDQSRFELT